MIENILLVEDEKEIARILVDHLRKEGFFVTWASTGKEGWEDFKQGDYSLVLVDLMLPEMDGFSLCEKIRLESNVPMFIISARQEDESKIRGLNLGADDYLTKPFSLVELTARIRSHLRRYRRYLQEDGSTARTTYEQGLSIDFEKKVAYLHGEPLLLTSKELDLLLLFAKNPYVTFTKAELYEHIWQLDDIDGNNTVTVHVKGLRTKLQDQTRASKFIQTIWGVGYRFIGEVVL
nr:response regulator transcription factor [Halalkalibacter okhensis]